MSAYSEAAKFKAQTPPAVGCLGKVAFDSFRLAADVLKRQTNKAPAGRSAYRCGHCSLWHLGTDVAHGAKARLAALKESRSHD